MSTPALFIDMGSPTVVSSQSPYLFTFNNLAHPNISYSLIDTRIDETPSQSF